MERIRRILAATDLSGRANTAVRRAAQVAHENRAALELLHIARPQPTLDLSGTAQERAEAGAEAQLQAAADLLHAHFGIEVGFEIKLGRPHEEIAEHAERREADLIVVGAHGEHFIADLLLGATASRLIRLTAKPVLVSRLAPADAYTGVVVGVDFSAASLSALRYARCLAPSATIWALHVLESEWGRPPHAGEAMAQLRGFAQSESGGAASTLMVEQGYPPQALFEKSARHRTGLICVGKHGLHETNPGLLGSVAKHVLAGASCDVAVVSP